MEQMAQMLGQLMERISRLETKNIVPEDTPQTSSPLELQAPRQEKQNEERPRPKLPKLAKFSGKRSEWKAWEMDAYSKLAIDGGAIGTARDQFAYIYASLETDAKNMVTAYYSANRQVATASGEVFIEYLATVFGNPNQKEEAANRLRSLRQRSLQPFSSFLPVFESTLAEAGGLSWPDDVKINQLKSSLNDQFRNYMISIINLPADYHGYVNSLRQVDTNIQAAGGLNAVQRKSTSEKPAEHLKTSPVTSPNLQEVKDQSHDKMEWQPTTSARSRAKWVSGEELQRRRSARLCVRCGASGHFIRQCPYDPPARQPTRAQVNHEAVLPLVEEETAMEQGKQHDQGKE